MTVTGSKQYMQASLRCFLAALAAALSVRNALAILQIMSNTWKMRRSTDLALLHELQLVQRPACKHNSLGVGCGRGQILYHDPRTFP